jgi:glycopeptide antibiotics resistance protein
MKNRYGWRVLAAFGYTSVVIYFSLIDLKPIGANPIGEIFIEIHMIGEGFIVHLMAYLLMGYLWKNSGLSSVRSFLLCFLIGMLIEVLQSFTNTRVFSLTDILANGLGSISGVILNSYMSPRRRRSSGISSTYSLII